MQSTESRSEVVRCQLEKILSSSGFARSERLSAFLRFVIEQELSGRGDQIKESIVGVEVFGRRPDYDVRQDSVVRTEAGKLRARLAKYYAAEGAADPLVIELPKGGYAPAFRQQEKAVETTAPPEPPAAARGRIWLVAALAGVVVSLATAGWWRSHYKDMPIPIAVLPLTNLSQDPANDYFADGLTDEIIRNLSIIDGLAVRSQTSSFVFKGKPRSIREAGKQLDADYILEGSVLRSGNQLRINAQLVRVRDDLPVWSGRYDRELTDVLAIQDEISRGIVNSLRLKLGRGRRRYEVNAEAYDLYLRARSLSIQGGLPGVDETVGLYEEVIAKDPSFAPAYAGLAVARAYRAGQFEYNFADEMSKMRPPAQRAVELDPLLAEAHEALGMVYARDAQWEQSEKSFRRAIELDRNRSTSYGDFVMFLLLPVGRFEEALKQLRVAEKADPLSPEIHYFLYYVLNAAGRYEEAERYCNKLPTGYWTKGTCMAQAHIRHGSVGQAVQVLEAEYRRGLPPGSEARGSLGCAYARAGRGEEAEKVAAASSFNPISQATIFACLGDKDRSFAALDRAAAAGPCRIGRALTWPEMSLLRGDPRRKALRKKVGLPE